MGVTMRPLTAAQRIDLESMIDDTSLASVVVALAEIAREKAEHIRANWQDAATARTWDSDAARLERACKLHN